ncbi:MAG: glycogen/starch synthase [bacterium]
MKEKKSPRVLFAVWELEPFFKVGGLGEVAHSLPKALYDINVDISVILPHYRALKTFGMRKSIVGKLKIKYGKKSLQVIVSKIRFLNDNIPVYLVENKEYFDKPVEGTFAVFALVVVELLKIKLIPGQDFDIVHCNDYHCGLIPLLLSVKQVKIKTLLTIHCVSHQRRSPVEIATMMGIPIEKLTLMKWETKERQLNFLLEGIIHADYINTVSPTYLKEIQTEEGGAELDRAILKNIVKISAILNGIDYETRNPATNPNLAVRYGKDRKPLLARKANKALLQQKFALPVRPDVTVIGFIGRLVVDQKGIDMLHRMLWREEFDHCQFVIMGHGEDAWEERFATLSAFFPDTISVSTKYDDALASIIYAGSDFVLIPSRFEPCGLIQMNAMRYGSIPIARETGGLNDTITHGKNGILYQEPTSNGLYKAINQGLELKKNTPKKYVEMIEEAMKTDFSWAKSAKEYLALYHKITSEDSRH